MPKANLSFLTQSLTPAQTALLTVWVLLMISFPFVDWMLGRDAMFSAVILGVLAQLIAVFTILWEAWGTRKTIRVGAIVILLSWIAEAWGTNIGFPFGAYDYTNTLQPQMLDVPIYIPLGWLIMLPPSWAVAQAASARINPFWRTSAFIILSALAMTAWDLMMDPMMVAWGMWVWDDTGSYFGIPWGNFLGWLLVAGLITAIIRPRDLPITPLLLIYTITWLLEMGGMLLFWNMPGPALVGGLVMGSFTIFGWRSVLRK
jgi:putative membrane protein